MTESMTPETPQEQSLLNAALSRARAARDRRIDVYLESMGLWLTCRVPADGRELERLQNAAARVEKGAVRGTEFNRAVVATFTEIIRVDGLELTDDDGNTVAFNDPKLWKMCGPEVQDSKSCVVAILGTDGAIANAAQQLIEYGGYLNPNDSDPI